MRNLEEIKKKIILLISRIKDDTDYLVVIDRDFILKHKLSRSASLNKPLISSFLKQIDGMNSETILWWMFACNNLWKQIQSKK